jgi:two-component system response regulator DesR
VISLLLAEDQGLMRSSLVTLLSLEPDFEVDSVADGAVALQRLRDGRYDVALLDIQLPGLSGLDVIRAVRDEHLDVHCVVVTTFPRPGYVRRAMDDGARGFLVKDRPVEELTTAIWAVAAGQVVIDDGLAVAALRVPPNPLSTREIEVLREARDGKTINEIGAVMHLSPSTARNYLSSAIGKLGAVNRTEARHRADQNGWL